MILDYKSLKKDLRGRTILFYDDYRLSKYDEDEIEWQKGEMISNISTEQIYSLPLTEQNREELIEAANWSLERIFNRIEPNNPELTR